MARSSGILVYRFSGVQVEFLLLKPGGPFYKSLDNGIWTIPKGEVQGNETEIETAKREFKEETGFEISSEMVYLDKFKLRKGKSLSVFLVEEEFDLIELKSTHFELEYPKSSGLKQKFPEIVSGKWMTFREAQEKVFPNQLPVLEKAIEKLRTSRPNLH